MMNFEEHPLVDALKVIEEAFYAGDVSLCALRETLGGIMSAMESDMPKPLAQALVKIESDLDQFVDLEETAEIRREAAAFLQNLSRARQQYIGLPLPIVNST